jgi:hypothetical protein
MNMDEDADRLRRLEQELAEVKLRTTVQPGIKGWLVLHAIGNVLSTAGLGLFTLVALREDAPPLLILIFAPLFLYVLFLTVSFFQHKKYVPGHLRFLLGFGVLLEIAYLVIDGKYLREGEIISTLAGMGFSVIWFIYYGVSERVKVTFTK